MISEIARGLALTADSDRLRDAYEYLLGQFAAGSGKKVGEFYTPQQISNILSGIVTLDSQEPKTGMRSHLDRVFDFACGSGSLLLNFRHRMKEAGGTIGKIYGQEYNVTTYNLARMNMLLHGVSRTKHFPPAMKIVGRMTPIRTRLPEVDRGIVPNRRHRRQGEKGLELHKRGLKMRQ